MDPNSAGKTSRRRREGAVDGIVCLKEREKKKRSLYKIKKRQGTVDAVWKFLIGSKISVLFG